MIEIYSASIDSDNNQSLSISTSITSGFYCDVTISRSDQIVDMISLTREQLMELLQAASFVLAIEDRADGGINETVCVQNQPMLDDE